MGNDQSKAESKPNRREAKPNQVPKRQSAITPKRVISGLLATIGLAVWNTYHWSNPRFAIWVAYATAMVCLYHASQYIPAKSWNRKPDRLRWRFVFGLAAVISFAITYLAQPHAEIVEPRHYFHVRILSLSRYDAEPFIYVYTNPERKQFLSLVGVLIDVEVTNLRPTATKITSYLVDTGLRSGSNWTRLKPVWMADPLSMYMANLSQCIHLDFTSSSFDMNAEATTLQPGGSIKGFMFFSLPKDQQLPDIQQLRFTFENSQGERETVTPYTPASETGRSQFGGSRVKRILPEVTDLSKVPLSP